MKIDMKKISIALFVCAAFYMSVMIGVRRAEKNEPVRAQFSMLADFALQQVMMMGQGAADSLFYQDEQERQKELFDERESTSENLKKSFEAITKSIKEERDKIGDQFRNRYKAVSTALNQASQDTINETTYIQRLVGKSYEDAGSFLMDYDYRIASDYLYALSSTHLPPGSATGPVWHNVMKNSGVAGNWMYDTDLSGFMQCGYALAPVFKSANVPGFFKYTLASMANIEETDDKGHKTGVVHTFAPAAVPSNIIFTEYYPQHAQLTSGYTIRGELTLTNAVFPFCAGIVFNKARYLPGSFERPFTFRFVGLYGDKDKKIGLYAGQTSIEKSDGMPFPSIKSPFDKIFTSYDDTDPAKITRSAKELYDLGAIADTIGKDQPTYVFEISVAQQRISVTLSKKSADATSTVIYRSPEIDPSQYPAVGVPGADMRLGMADPKQNEALFWYHDIGLVAVGCQGLWNITKPENLMPHTSGT